MKWNLAVLPVILAITFAQDGTRPAAVKIDFDKFEPGGLPDELMVVEGEFRIAAEGDNKVLEMQPAPVVDGTVLLGPSITGPGVVRARIKAEKARRAFPRFGVGLHGISGVKLRVVPAQKMIELVEGDEQLARADFEWKDNEWLTVELALIPKETGWVAEARAWNNPAKRPEPPVVTAAVPDSSGQGRASVLGSPYANKPILFDDIEVVPGKAAAGNSARGGGEPQK
jgi:hypothetical protein